MRNYYSNPETGQRTRKPDPRYSSTGHKAINTLPAPFFYTIVALGLLYIGLIYA
jgi:hypothetical protein